MNNPASIMEIYDNEWVAITQEEFEDSEKIPRWIPIKVTGNDANSQSRYLEKSSYKEPIFFLYNNEDARRDIRPHLNSSPSIGSGLGNFGDINLNKLLFLSDYFYKKIDDDLKQLILERFKELLKAPEDSIPWHSYSFTYADTVDTLDADTYSPQQQWVQSQPAIELDRAATSILTRREEFLRNMREERDSMRIQTNYT